SSGLHYPHSLAVRVSANNRYELFVYPNNTGGRTFLPTESSNNEAKECVFTIWISLPHNSDSLEACSGLNVNEAGMCGCNILPPTSAYPIHSIYADIQKSYFSMHALVYLSMSVLIVLWIFVLIFGCIRRRFTKDAMPKR